MRHPYLFALVLGAMTAVIASPQSISSDLATYLSLTDAQTQAINGLNNDFVQYIQQIPYVALQLEAEDELSKDSPDPEKVGRLFARMERYNREYNAQLTQVQSKVAALLTPDQAMRVAALLDVVRLQPLVIEALCASLETESGDFFSTATGIPFSSDTCSVPPLPTALVNYLNLSDGQVSAMQNAIQANLDQEGRQSLKIQMLEDEIQKLTDARKIDVSKLGADYVALARIQRDEGTETEQLTVTLRSVLTDQQQPQLKALDNALALSLDASVAVSANILTLPPDLNANLGCNLSPYPATKSILGCFSGQIGPGFLRTPPH